jgi:RHS repeat-associated protein
MVLWLFPGFGRVWAGDGEIHFDVTMVPVVKVSAVTASRGQTARELALRAELNYPQALDHVDVVWRLEGGAGDARVTPRDRGTATLVLGAGNEAFTVVACASDGSKEAGCRKLTLQSELLSAAMDQARWEEIVEQDWDDVLCLGRENEALRYVFAKVGSRVNTVTGEYNREHTDLLVKVAGGALAVRRAYRRGAWHWQGLGEPLGLERGTRGDLAALVREGVRYLAEENDLALFAAGNNRLRQTADGFRWESRDGRWERYAADGRKLSFGHRGGLVGSLIYRGGRLAGVADRKGAVRIHLLYDAAGRLSMASDGVARWAGYDWEAGRLRAVTWADGRRRRFFYDAEGRLIRVVNPGGAETRIAYDFFGKVIEVRDGDGADHRFRYTFDPQRGLYRVERRSPGEALQEVWYDARGEAREVRRVGKLVWRTDRNGSQLVITDAAGRVTVKRFDAWDRLQEVIFPDGSRRLWEYDSDRGLLVRQVDEMGVETRFAYDEAGRRVEQVEAAGTEVERITRWQWDADGNLVNRVRAAGRAEEAVEVMGYDADGRRIWMKDPAGGVTRFAYDETGDLVEICDPAGACRRMDYDPMGRRVAVTDALGHTTRWSCDRRGDPVLKTDSLGRVSRMVRDPQGWPVRLLDAAGGVTAWDYDAARRLVSRTDPAGKQVRWGYDEIGRLAWQEDGGGNRIAWEYGESADPAEGGCRACGDGAEDRPARQIFPTFIREFAYDSRGRVVARTDLAGEERLTTAFTYDTAGRLAGIDDPAGRSWCLRRDALGRVRTVVDPLGNETHYTYDALDRLVAFTDGNGHAHRRVYDGMGRLIAETRPLGQTTRYAYDAAGRLMELLRASGRTSRFTYDILGRLIRTRHFDGPRETGSASTITMVYDAAGNLVSYDDGITRGVYAYDALDRRIIETVDFGDFTLKQHYGFEANGRRGAYTGPDGVTRRYAYDAADRLVAIGVPGLGAIQAGEYLWNQPGSVAVPGGSMRRNAFDGFGRVRSIAVADPQGQVLMDYRYGYDKLGQVTHLATERGSVSYTYDALNRLTGVDHPDRTDEFFTYDAAGNRLSSAEEPTWTYNANDELEACGAARLAYDADGNVVSREDAGGRIHYHYNAEGRLSRVTDGAGREIAAYGYDPFGRRVWKAVDGKKTWFHYAEEGLAGEYDAKGRALRTYGWSPQGQWGTDPLWMQENGRTWFYHTDHLGTPVTMSDPDGKVVWEANWQAFGQARVSPTSKVANHLRLAGQYADAETGLHDNFYRTYDPATGRYWQTDPLGLAGAFGGYAYVQSNPINFIDPLGLLQFRYHGNWGGPGWAAGKYLKEAMLTQRDFDKIVATDDRDRCYKEHDMCIWECYNDMREDISCEEGWSLSNCIEDCDHMVGTCLLKIGPWQECFWLTDRGEDENGNQRVGLPVFTPLEATLFHTLIPIFIH